MSGDQFGRGPFNDASIWRPSTQSSDAPSLSTELPRKNTDKSYTSYTSSPLGIVTSEEFTRGRPLHRFLARTLALVLGPLVIAGYFIFIWQFFLKDDGPVKYGTFDERWIFYSWFVVGVFGLSISQFGIIGIEAAMLQDPFWKTTSAMELMMHSGSSWAGAGGWARCLAGSIRWKKSMAGRLWYLLSFITMALFIGLPISGLSFELADGYIHSSEHPMVIGRTWSNYHSRDVGQAENRGEELWKTGASVSLPGVGLAYTPPNVDRDQFSFLDAVPNSLPIDDGVPELFIAPQANGPISGEAWGLRLSYSCSVVESASEFTILDKKGDYKMWGYESRAAFNSTNVNVDDGAVAKNIWAYAEMRAGPDYDSPWARAANSSESPESDPDDDVYVAGILEYALWQVRLAPGTTTEYRISVEPDTDTDTSPDFGISLAPDSTTDSSSRTSSGSTSESTSDTSPDFRIAIRANDPAKDTEGAVDFDSSLKPSIPDIGSPWKRGPDGTYEVDESFFSRQVDQAGFGTETSVAPAANLSKIRDIISEMAEPIGVRCRHMSVFGTAQLDAKTTSFRDFTPAPPVFDASRMTTRTPMFGTSARKFLPNHYFDLFTATNSPAPEMSGPATLYNSYVKPDKLMQAILRAYGQDALSLMYDGLPAINGGYENANLTSSREGKVLELGIVPPLVPAIWLSLWAFVCALMGLAYGFRRRWTAALDGYTLFRFGADFGREVGTLSSVGAFEECERLWDLPGFVGDAWRGEDVGYVSLVPGNEVAEKGKLYV